MYDLDEFLEAAYEDRNGSSDDFYSYNSRDFDEGWNADTWEPDIDDFLDEEDED